MILGTPEMEFYKVIVDPRTGKILASQEIPKMELMQMHRMMGIENHIGRAILFGDLTISPF